MSFIMPILIALLLIYSLIRGVDVYSAFIEGAKQALPTIYSILPYMAAMMIAMGVFRSSGALDFIVSLLSPIFEKIGLPPELSPLFMLRPFSGNASMALVKDVFDTYGVDTFLGIAASLMLGSTETVFYTISLYFGSIGVKKTRSAIPAALISGIVGAALAIIFAKIMTA